MSSDRFSSIPLYRLTPRLHAEWPIHAATTLLLAVAVLMIYQPVVRFTVATWLGNETYMHGFLIPLISGWLIWRERDRLTPVHPAITYRPLALLFLVGIVWELGYQSGSMVVQQYSVVSMIVLIAWIMLGNTVFRILRFPLLFLFFAVPFGESLIPAMIRFTANFTADALALSGIPVYRDGNLISVPSGNWSVVEACSGLRYFVSSITLGVLYAHLAYRSWFRKFLFILAALLVPVFANGARAYLIVMIGHLSNMKLAVGVDHLIYGWIFFGIVMLLLFWVGSWFQEARSAQSDLEQKSTLSLPIQPFSISQLIIAAMAIMVLVIFPVGYAYYLQQQPITPTSIVLTPLPSTFGRWQTGYNLVNDLHPHYLGSTARLTQGYTTPDKQIMSLFVAYYCRQHPGTELITIDNKLVTTHDPVWQETQATGRNISLHDSTVPVTEEKLVSGDRQLLVWEWYWVDGHWVNNPYIAKILEAKSRLWNHRDDAAVIVIATPYIDRMAAEANLHDFLQQMLPSLNYLLNHAHRQTR